MSLLNKKRKEQNEINNKTKTINISLLTYKVTHQEELLKAINRGGQ